MTRLNCESAGERIDSWVAGRVAELSRARVQRLLLDGFVRVNGRPVAKNYRMNKGDQVEFALPPPRDPEMLKQDIGLQIVYEDAHIVVVDKPRGMVVHPGAGNPAGTLANALLHHCAGSLSDINGVARPGIVHRLDKDTSGLIVAAKTNAAHLRLAADFKARKVRKIYQTVVLGHVLAASGRIELPVGRDPAGRKRMAVVETGGKDAVSLFRVLQRLPGPCAWLEVEILTGRTHQIRVHMAHIGHPVAGDALYGGAPRALEALAGAARGQILHAASLTFTHPATGERLELESPLPAYFTDFLSRLSGG